MTNWSGHIQRKLRTPIGKSQSQVRPQSNTLHRHYNAYVVAQPTDTLSWGFGLKTDFCTIMHVREYGDEWDNHRQKPIPQTLYLISSWCFLTDWTRYKKYCNSQPLKWKEYGRPIYNYRKVYKKWIEVYMKIKSTPPSREKMTPTSIFIWLAEDGTLHTVMSRSLLPLQHVKPSGKNQL